MERLLACLHGQASTIQGASSGLGVNRAHSMTSRVTDVRPGETGSFRFALSLRSRDNHNNWHDAQRIGRLSCQWPWDAVALFPLLR